MLAILFLLVGARNPTTWLLWTMIVAVVSRYLIATGMIAGPTLAKPQPLRFVGALGTDLTGILLCFGAFMTRARTTSGFVDHRRARGPVRCMGAHRRVLNTGQVTGSQCSRTGGFCLVGWSREASPNRVKTGHTGFSAGS
jgi:hypothetical protein